MGAARTSRWSAAIRRHSAPARASAGLSLAPPIRRSAARKGAALDSRLAAREARPPHPLPARHRRAPGRKTARPGPSWRPPIGNWRSRRTSCTGHCCPSTSSTGDTRFRDKLVASIEDGLRKSLEHALGNGYLRLIIFSGRMLKVALEAIDVLRWRGELDDATQRRWARQIASLAYCFADPDYWPWTAFPRSARPARAWRGLLGRHWRRDLPAEFRDGVLHERSPSWIDLRPSTPRGRLDFVRRGVVRAATAEHFYESGAYIESMTNTSHELRCSRNWPRHSGRPGRRDFFEHPRSSQLRLLRRHAHAAHGHDRRSARPRHPVQNNLNPPAGERSG